MGLGGAIEAGQAYVKFLLDDSEFHKKLKGFGARLSNAGSIGMAATGPLIAALGLCLSTGIALGGQLSDMSDRTGIAASSLERLGFVADESGVSMEDLEKPLRKMQQLLGDTGSGGEQFRKTVRGLGVDYQSLREQSPDEQFVTLGAAIAGIEDPALRAATANKIFGKSGAAILPMLAKGADAFRKAAAESDRLGATVGDDEVKALDDLGDALGHSKKQLIGLASHIAAALAGPLTQIVKWAQDWLAVVNELIKEHPNLTRTVAALAAAAFTLSAAMWAVGKAVAFVGLIKNLASIGAAIKGLASLAAANPVLAIIVGIVAALGGLVYWFSKSKKGADDLNGSLKGVKQPAEGILAPPSLQERQNYFPLRSATNVGPQSVIGAASSAGMTGSDGGGNASLAFLSSIAETNRDILLYFRGGGGSMVAGAG